ncbi:MAG: threonine/serine dehydratase [Promethearchaeota archaeon]
MMKLTFDKSLFTLSAFQRTLEKISPYVLNTPVIRSYSTEELLPDKKIYFKLEFLQPTNSFKVRGACSKLTTLNDEQLKKGLVVASGGNAGLGVCYAGKQFNSPVKVVLPERTAKEKLEKISKWGGEVELYGEAWDESNAYAMEYAENEGLTYVHPFDDAEVILGQGTIALEFLQQTPDLDVIIASVGGGGLITGIGLAAKLVKDVKIWGVETVGADALTQSFKAGYPITLDAITSIADTLGAKRTTDRVFSLFTKAVDEMVTVTDQEALKALEFLLENEKILVEVSTSCIVAALLKESLFNLSDVKNIGIVICGGNISLRQLHQWGSL